MIVINDEQQRPFVSKGSGKAQPLRNDRRPSGVPMPEHERPVREDSQTDREAPLSPPEITSGQHISSQPLNGPTM